MTRSWSLQRRLVIQLSILALLLAVALFLAVRWIAAIAANVNQDGLLGASAISISEQLELVDGKPFVDMPYSALSILATYGEHRIFYAVRAADGGLITGYDEVQPYDGKMDLDTPEYFTTEVMGLEVRATTITKRLLGENASEVTVTVTQTREEYAQIRDNLALAAAVVGAGFLFLAGLLGFPVVRSALKPLTILGESLAKRDASNFRPLDQEVPSELRPFVKSLNDFIERLRSTLTTSENFITEAAHRIRTPLAVLSAEAELAGRDTDLATMRQRIGKIRRTAAATSRITSQLLSQAMIAYRANQRARETVVLSDIVAMALRDTDAAADARTIDFVVDVPRDLTFEGDGIAMLEALRNLLDNAVKYAPEGSEVLVSAKYGDEGRVCIQVDDAGPGIPASDRDRVVRRFERGADGPAVDGTGLGLSIVREVAQNHGGTLVLETSSQGGLAACLSVPSGGSRGIPS